MVISSDNFSAIPFNLVNDLVASLVGSTKPGFHSFTIFLIERDIPPKPSSKSKAATLAFSKREVNCFTPSRLSSSKLTSIGFSPNLSLKAFNSLRSFFSCAICLGSKAI